MTRFWPKWGIVPTEGFNFPQGDLDDPYRALLIAAETLRMQPEDDALVGPWDEAELYLDRRVEVQGSDELISLVERRLIEAGMIYVLDPRPDIPVGDGRYIRYVDAV